MQQTKPRTGVCEPLLQNVVAHEAHQNDRSYVHKTVKRISHGGWLHGGPHKPTELSKLPEMSACPGQYGT